ncbi:MutS protein 1 [Diatrype stigma]|uniref:DNA mismatch repair protein n=1 Tax=Diatrype stigma TaxID=117547 RepID=A0AAN9VB12_9PEZI
MRKFLKILVLDLNCYVAVAEEFPNDPSDRIKANGLMHDRKVTRIITPGTLIDEGFIDPYANNYVMAVHINSADQEESGITTTTTVAAGPTPGDPTESVFADAPIGLAWLDVSTGQFYTQSTTVSSLSSILSRVAPREIVVDEILQSQKDHHSLFSVLAEDKHFITFAPQGAHLPLSEWTPMLESEIPPQAVAGFTADEVAAGSLLLQYVRNRLLVGGMAATSLRLQAPQRHESLAVMTIDKTSMRSLEIKQTIRDGTFRGSLLHAVRGTVTKGGARLLSAWLGAPSTSLDTIRARQDLVAAFIADDDLRDAVVQLLRRCHDSQRLVQKFAFGRGDADDMIHLANTIQATEDIASLLERYGTRMREGRGEEEVEAEPSGGDNGDDGGATCFDSLLSRITLDEPVKLAARIRNSIDEEGLVQQHRNEDSEAGELAALAEDVVVAEGAKGGDGGGDGATSIPKAAAAAAAAARKRKATASIREYYSAVADDSNVPFMMKAEASPGLRTLHAELAALLREKAALAETLREQHGAPSLTLKWQPNLGHIVHVKGKDARNISASSATTTRKPRKTAAEKTTTTTKKKRMTKREKEAAEAAAAMVEEAAEAEKEREKATTTKTKKKRLTKKEKEEAAGAAAMEEESRRRNDEAGAQAVVAEQEEKGREEEGEAEAEGEADGNDGGSGGGMAITTLSTSRSTRTLHLPAWTELGQRIHRARYEIAAEERRLFAELRAHVVQNLVRLRRNAAALDELDVLAASFARLAVAGENPGGSSSSSRGSGDGGSGGVVGVVGGDSGYVRPILDDSTSHAIIGGRHPTVEAGLRERGRTFTKNDCLIGSGSRSGSGSGSGDNNNSSSSGGGGGGGGGGVGGSGKLWLITGPNMAGKSTYLRQNALITILAQAGSWVPADHARLGVVDALYSRVGSAAGDSLHTDQSTFMVEMTEAAQILRRATPRSLVVMDEVGRGTTPQDGAAVAFAALHHLAAVNRCRGLFATHFHVLADWARERGMLVGQGGGGGGGGEEGGEDGGRGQVDAYCTDVEEDGAGGFVYVHKLKRGVNRQSHALKVARLAGLPEAAVTVAREILSTQADIQIHGDDKAHDEVD